MRTGTVATSLSRGSYGFEIETTGGSLFASHVIVATGAFQRLRIPPFADQLSPSILQLHSSSYWNPDQLNPGDVLVVGAGNSGAQIAIELAATRRVWLSGPDTGTIPRRVLGRDVYWWIWPTLLNTSIDSRFGRRLREKLLLSADPLVGIKKSALGRSGLERTGRTIYVSQGMPVVEGGVTLNVNNVIWCTGYRPDFSWIDLPVFGADGYPLHRRGVVRDVPGLYFVGLRFLYRFRSSLIGGVGEDAEYVTSQITGV